MVLDDLHAVVMLSQAGGPLVDIEESKALKRHAKVAMQLLRAFREAFRDAAQEALEKVARWPPRTWP